MYQGPNDIPPSFNLLVHCLPHVFAMALLRGLGAGGRPEKNQANHYVDDD
jgi:hypothetical protein